LYKIDTFWFLHMRGLLLRLLNDFFIWIDSLSQGW
jgi:hypothetical protein